jgi:hypothetical protein
MIAIKMRKMDVLTPLNNFLLLLMMITVKRITAAIHAPIGPKSASDAATMKITRNSVEQTKQQSCSV